MDQRRLAGVGQHLRGRGALARRRRPVARPAHASPPAEADARCTRGSPACCARRSRRAAPPSATTATPAASAAASSSQLAAYGRGGEPCLRCGARLIGPRHRRPRHGLLRAVPEVSARAERQLDSPAMAAHVAELRSTCARTRRTDRACTACTPRTARCCTSANRRRCAAGCSATSALPFPEEKGARLVREARAHRLGVRAERVRRAACWSCSR